MELPADQATRSTLTGTLPGQARAGARYLLSFTAGGLFRREAPLVAACYLAPGAGDWTRPRPQLQDVPSQGDDLGRDRPGQVGIEEKILAAPPDGADPVGAQQVRLGFLHRRAPHPPATRVNVLSST